MHQQSINQLGERLARLETQPQSLSQLPVSGNLATDPLREEHGRRIQELQIWVQALNGGTSALVHPRNWENPILGIQAEQKTQNSQWEELNQLCNQIRKEYHGLVKDLSRQQEKFDRLPIETLEEKYRKLEFRLGEIQRLGAQPIHDKITSSGLHSIHSTPTQFAPTHSNPMPSDRTQSSPTELNAIRVDSNPAGGIDPMPVQSSSTSSNGRSINPPPRTLSEKVDYLMKHLECLDRHITQFEQGVEDQFQHHEASIKGVSDHSCTIATSHNEVADHVDYLLQTVDKMQQSWENWAEWTPVDQDQEQGQEAQLPIREEPVPESQQHVMEPQQPVLDYSSRTLLDVTPVHTPVQGVRDVNPLPLPVVTSTRVSTPECACSRLALPSLKGVTRI